MTGPVLGGVRLAGIGSAVPPNILTNDDLSKMVDTSDEWIKARTGIERRHICDPEKGEGEFTLARDALQRALDDAGMAGSDLDFIIHASVTSEMRCPSNACRIASALGVKSAGAFDLCAACSGFMYGLNLGESLVRIGRQKNVGVIGCDALSTICDYSERTVSILFGDGAGAVVLTPDPDPGRGCLFQTMGSDGDEWDKLYMPYSDREVPEWDRDNPIRYGCLRMSGREVYKFAVTKFRKIVAEAMEATGLTVDDVAQFVCHQSNARIIESAIDKLGLPPEKVHINIDEYGNTSAGSVGLVLDDLYKLGKIKRDDIIILVAFGGGLTWASSVWRV